MIEYLAEWSTAMQAAQRSPRTVDNYTAGVRAFAAHAGDLDVTEVTPSHIRSWLADLAERAAPKTVASRYQAVRAFFDWLTAEGEVPESVIRKVQRPTFREPEISIPTVAELQAVLATATDVRSFADVRDTAVIRLWLDTGIRREELAGLTVADLDTTAAELRVMGKGRKPRTVGYGAKTARAFGRYLRLRARHPYAHESGNAKHDNKCAGCGPLWLGDRGRGPIDGASLYTMLHRRAARAGVELHPHQLRHFFADQWLSEGGSEGDLMQLAGWSNRQMLDRYASAHASQRSRAARRRMTLGDAV